MVFGWLRRRWRRDRSTDARPDGGGNPIPTPGSLDWGWTVGLAAAVALAAALGGCVGGAGGGGAGSDVPSDGDPAFQPRVFEPAGPAPSLDGLVDTTGHPFSLDALRGRVVLVNFGYTHCPDVCPTTLAIGREVLRARPDQVGVVFVTVDPERDTPAALASYLRFFEAPIVGLTGSPDRIGSVTAAWGVTAIFGERDAAGNYPVTHSAGTYVVDPDGRLRYLYPYGTPASVLVHAVDALVEGR
jgi:protein SCO1/2